MADAPAAILDHEAEVLSLRIAWQNDEECGFLALWTSTPTLTNGEHLLSDTEKLNFVEVTVILGSLSVKKKIIKNEKLISTVFAP